MKKEELKKIRDMKVLEAFWEYSSLKAGCSDEELYAWHKGFLDGLDFVDLEEEN